MCICTIIIIGCDSKDHRHPLILTLLIEVPLLFLCSGVDLPFSWLFYRPVGVPLHSSPPNDGDVPVIKQLIPTTERLFSVQPSTGLLRAGQSKNFICQFLPQKVSAHATTVYACTYTCTLNIKINFQHSVYMYMYYE